MTEQHKILEEVTSGEYKFGFVSDFEADTLPKGLNEQVIRTISAKKGEPEFMLQFRLDAFHKWEKMKMPDWPNLRIPEIDFQDISYYSAPKQDPRYKSMDEVDPELLETFNKLGIPLDEQKILAGVAVDAVIDSVSVKTTFKDTLAEKGIIFCSFSEAVKEHPDLVQKYLGMSVPVSDNFFAALIGSFPDDHSVMSQRVRVRWSCQLISGSMQRTVSLSEH